LKPEEYLEKKIIPVALMQAVLKAREASKAQKDFHKELALYLKKCQRHELKPRIQWLDLLRWLSEGRETMDILEALQISPTSIHFLEILESLKAHGFPDEFLNGLILEIPSAFLDSKAKETLRVRIPLDI